MSAAGPSRAEPPRVDPATLQSAKASASARRRQRGLFSRPRHWLGLHAFGLVSSLGRMTQRPLAALMTIGVMAIALALPVALGLTLANVQRFSGSVRASRQITVFLHQDIGMDRANALATQLRARHDVREVIVRSPAEGLAEFRKMSDLAPAVDALDGNPLPPVLLVEPADDGAAVAASLKTLPEADVVQQDAVWRERLSAWLAFGERIAWILAALLGAGALLVVGNTVRLDIQHRSEEIGVLQFLGATDGFVRRPFLYLGAIYGFAAGLLALGLLALAGLALQPPLARLIASYGGDFRLQGPGPVGIAALLAGPLLLGWLGAWLATGHHLRRNRPGRT
ncbi:MAG TPA: permease-like cell division protein FtsX [Xanthomonadaceae bacterium]|jgi:cell division transport system permease protein